MKARFIDFHYNICYVREELDWVESGNLLTARPIYTVNITLYWTNTQNDELQDYFDFYLDDFDEYDRTNFISWFNDYFENMSMHDFYRKFDTYAPLIMRKAKYSKKTE